MRDRLVSLYQAVRRAGLDGLQMVQDHAGVVSVGLTTKIILCRSTSWISIRAHSDIMHCLRPSFLTLDEVVITAIFALMQKLHVINVAFDPNRSRRAVYKVMKCFRPSCGDSTQSLRSPPWFEQKYHQSTIFLVHFFSISTWNRRSDWDWHKYVGRTASPKRMGCMVIVAFQKCNVQCRTVVLRLFL